MLFFIRKQSIGVKEPKINVLAEGTRTPAFFHRSVKVWWHRNKIHTIKDLLGNILIDLNDIQNCFIDFYKNLWSSSSDFNLESLSNALSNDYPVLCDVDRVALIRPISKREVYHTFNSMPQGKSPRPDGFNVEFYLFYWNLIGDHLFNAISYFFDTAKMPHSWGKYFVALIPKSENPISIKDFSPNFPP